jgi:hypothetical protein
MPRDPHILKQKLAAALEQIDWPQAILANFLIIGVLICAKALLIWDADLFYRSVQEDEALEWATFWAFSAAGVVALVGALGQRKAGVRFPWFMVGLSLFCFFVAMEEVSWGQRLLGYRPPAYFLEQNFQQELNLHNVVSTDLRKLALKAVILGYGVLLPLIALIPPVGRWFRRLTITPPPWTLIPSFLVTYATYQIYPWKFSGEVVELMLGLAFLFALLGTSRMGSEDATVSLEDPRSEDLRSRNRRDWLDPLKAWLAVIVLGAVTAITSQAMTRRHPAKLDAAQIEVEALLSDFQSLPEIKCSSHKRIYSYVQKYDGADLEGGKFANLVAQGLPEERVSFFLDPWNSPYWIRHRCSEERETTTLFLYSFGPNRKRDSTRTEILSDDIAARYLP